MTAGVRPFLGVSHSRMSREQPWRQLAKVGEASRVLRVAARLLRPRGEEVVHVERADALDGRVEDLVEQGAELRRLALLQAPLGQHREQHVLAAPGGVGVLAEQPKHERYGRAHGGAARLGVGVPRRGASLEGRQDVNGLARRRPGRQHVHAGARPEQLEIGRFIG
jgi:hypothetical protein